MFVKSSLESTILASKLRRVTNVLRWLFQICVATLAVLFSLPFLILIIVIVAILFQNGSTESSGIVAVTGGISLPVWFSIALALPLFIAGLYFITRWAKHRR